MIFAFDALIMYKPMVALQTEHYRLKARALYLTVKDMW